MYYLTIILHGYQLRDHSRRIVDECVTMCRMASKDRYLKIAQWEDVNGLCYEVSGFSAMTLQKRPL